MIKIHTENEFYNLISEVSNKIPNVSKYSDCFFMQSQVQNMIHQGLYYTHFDDELILYLQSGIYYQIYCILNLTKDRVSISSNHKLIWDFNYSNPQKEKQIDALRILENSGFKTISTAQKMICNFETIPSIQHYYQVEKIQEADILSIVQLWNDTLRMKCPDISFTVQDIVEYKKRGTIYCFKENNHIMAAVFCENINQSCVIWHLAVEKKYQGNHLGVSLLQQVLISAQKNNLKNSWLWVESDNLPAISLYKKFGYVFLNKYTKRLIY